MLTISKPLSASHAHAYHREEFANAQANCYSDGDIVRSEWNGKLAEQWGLHGEVWEGQFLRMANGQHPITGEQLVRHAPVREYVGRRGERVRMMRHRAGWDAVFSAPKSVSLTALVGRDQGVRQAHRESVRIALDEFEKYVQAGMSDHQDETTGKWVVASFEHDSARPVDGYAAPHLHTHVVFFNVTETEKGETRALNPYELYRSMQYGTAIYRSELALRLRELGYDIEQGKSCQPEIKGYTREYLEASSRRRQQINDHLEHRGLSSVEANRIAKYQTRERKLKAITHEEMQVKNVHLASCFGDQPQRIVSEARVRQLEKISPERRRREIENALSYSREKNLEGQGVAHERDLLRDALQRSLGYASFADVRVGLEIRSSFGDLIERESRMPGRVFTTHRMIEYERDCIAVVRAGQQQYEHLVSTETWHDICGRHSRLSSTQRAAVEQLLSSRDKILAMESIAGAGKTRSLAAIREAAERDGYEVRGLAPSWAARKLAESGIESGTLQHHLAHEKQVKQKRLYVLHESCLASTKQLNEFLHRMQMEDRAILVRAKRQQRAVEADIPYQRLQEAGMQIACLDEDVRQTVPARHEVVKQVSRRNVGEAIAALEAEGRIHEIVNREERLTKIVREYAQDPKRTLVISPDNESREEMNTLVRRAMQKRGDVCSEEHTLRVLVSRQEMTGADVKRAGQYETGDVVLYSRGSKLLGIEPGENARVINVNLKENRISIEHEGRVESYDPRRVSSVAVYREVDRVFSGGDRVQFTAPLKNLNVTNGELGTIQQANEAGDLEIRMDAGREIAFCVCEHPYVDHGYAITSRTSGRLTADRVLIHMDTEKSERLVNTRLAYVSASSGRYDVQIFTDNWIHLRNLSRDLHPTATQVQESREQGQRVGSSSAHDRVHEFEQALGNGLGVI